MSEIITLNEYLSYAYNATMLIIYVNKYYVVNMSPWTSVIVGTLPNSIASRIVHNASSPILNMSHQYIRGAYGVNTEGNIGIDAWEDAISDGVMPLGASCIITPLKG